MLQGLTFSVEPGQRVALVGPNGAGKTTLLLALVGAAPFAGPISVSGLELCGANLEAVRRRVGYVFADPSDQLFLPRVEQEVAFGPEQRGVSGEELTARVRVALEAVGLSGYEQRLGSQLSLGEQRRLALATALAIRPRVILLDEPTANLDPRARRRVLETVQRVEATVVLATHDLEAALELDARVLILGEHRLLSDGPARELLRRQELLEAAGLELPLSVRLSGDVGAGSGPQNDDSPR